MVCLARLRSWWRSPGRAAYRHIRSFDTLFQFVDRLWTRLNAMIGIIVEPLRLAALSPDWLLSRSQAASHLPRSNPELEPLPLPLLEQRWLSPRRWSRNQGFHCPWNSSPDRRAGCAPASSKPYKSPIFIVEICLQVPKSIKFRLRR